LGGILGPGILEEASIERKVFGAMCHGWIDFTYHEGNKNKKFLENKVESVGAIVQVNPHAAPFCWNP
jgi:hypothetical protein